MMAVLIIISPRVGDSLSSHPQQCSLPTAFEVSHSYQNEWLSMVCIYVHGVYFICVQVNVNVDVHICISRGPEDNLECHFSCAASYAC